MGSGYNGENFRQLNAEHRARRAAMHPLRRRAQDALGMTLVVAAAAFLWAVTLAPVVVPAARSLGWWPSGGTVAAEAGGQGARAGAN